MTHKIYISNEEIVAMKNKNLDTIDKTVIGSINEINNKMPVITDTYDTESSNGMSGKAVASAIEDLDIPIVTDTYSAEGTDAVSGKAVASAISSIDLSTKMDKASPSGTGNLTMTGDVIATKSNGTKVSLISMPTFTLNGTTLTITTT